MLRILMAAGAVALSSSLAMAADMPAPAPIYKAPAAVPSPAYNWSGFYVGLNAGGTWGRSNDPTSVVNGTGLTYFATAALPGVNSVGAGQSTNTSGFTGGVQAGYNWQWGNLVAGIETEFDYFGQTGSSATGAVYQFTVPIPFTFNSSVRADWLFTARPRLGMATGNWLWYGTGGLAVTQLKANWSFADNQGSNESASASATKVGWVVGGGVETALPGKLLLGVEYLYVKFGSISATSTNLAFSGATYPTTIFSHSADLSSNIVRVRLSKQF
jgi:outer membrane immunogenic protein